VGETFRCDAPPGYTQCFKAYCRLDEYCVHWYATDETECRPLLEDCDPDAPSCVCLGVLERQDTGCGCSCYDDNDVLEVECNEDQEPRPHPICPGVLCELLDWDVSSAQFFLETCDEEAAQDPCGVTTAGPCCPFAVNLENTAGLERYLEALEKLEASSCEVSCPEECPTATTASCQRDIAYSRGQCVLD